MKKMKKMFSLTAMLSFVLVFLVGCGTPQEKALFNALMKTTQLNSYETQTTANIGFDIKGLPDKDMQQIGPILALFNNIGISSHSKMSKSADNTQIKSQNDLKLDAGLFGIDTSIWTSSAIENNKPVSKTIVKIPEMLAQTLPDTFKGKQYLVIDTNELANIPGASEAGNGIDFTKLANFNKEMSAQLTEFLAKYVEQYDPKLNIVTDLGKQDVKTPEGTVNANIYEVKLDDAAAKQLFVYTVNNALQNKEALTFLKNYIIESAKVSGADAKAIAELETSFAEFEKSLPTTLADFNKFAEELKNVKFLGNKGIDIKFAVNSDGYIINTTGTVDLVIDVAKISELIQKMDKNAKPQTEAIPPMVISLTVDFNSSMYNLNKEVKIDIPSVDKNNSVGLMDLIASSMQDTNQPKPPVKPPVKPQPPVKPGKPAKPTKPTTPTITITKKSPVVTISKVMYIQVENLKSIKGTYSISKTQVKVVVNGKNVVLKAGNKSVTINGKVYKLSVSPVVTVKGKVYISTELLSKLGIKVVRK